MGDQRSFGSSGSYLGLSSNSAECRVTSEFFSVEAPTRQIISTLVGKGGIGLMVVIVKAT